MRAFLIDPFQQEVTEVNYSGDFKQIYEFIDAHTFDVARLNAKGDGIYVDDEGLYAEDQRFFQHKFYPSPLAGKGLVLGCDMDTGESASASMTLEQLVDDIEWVMPIRVNGEVVWINA
tara:strand:+ start:376 stop:729 length:354 start_codon:yes stop_codon:yes gene_type:complete